MRPLGLNIVHLTPGRHTEWQKAQQQYPSAGFRSPPPWLSRPIPSPLPVDEKDAKQSRYSVRELPPRYSVGSAVGGSGLVVSERKKMLQEFFAELFGTFIMILFGDGVVAQTILAKGTRGDFQSVNWAWGVGVMLGVFVAKKSGGHLNPAITLANCVYRGFPWHKLPVYAMAQLLGAMLGALVVLVNYSAAIDLLEGGAGFRTVDPASPTSTAGLFTTFPESFLSVPGRFLSEFLSSAIMMFCVFALVDAGLGSLLPLFLLFLVFGIGASFGWETGYAMNLARDFGPRLVCFFSGYGSAVFSAADSYFWIPMVAPFVGTLFGGFLYDVFIYTGDESPLNPPWTRPTEPV